VRKCWVGCDHKLRTIALKAVLLYPARQGVATIGSSGWIEWQELCFINIAVIGKTCLEMTDCDDM